MSKAQRNPYLSWENDYLFIKDGDSLLCLVCKTRLQTFKKYNVQRHYAKIHESEFRQYDGEIRKKKINELKNKILQKSFSHENDCNIEKKRQIMHASYEVLLAIAQNKKKYF